MSDQTRRVWRAGKPALVVVGLFAGVAGVVIPVLAYLIYRSEGDPWIPALLIGLTVLALAYAWRFGLHPRLVATDRGVEVVNPMRRSSLEWDDITVIAPGENGLVVASEEQRAEAWCVQKSNRATRRGQVTRADLIAHQLLDILEVFDPPLEDDADRTADPAGPVRREPAADPARTRRERGGPGPPVPAEQHPTRRLRSSGAGAGCCATAAPTCTSSS